MIATRTPENAGLELVHERAVLDGPIEVTFRLKPGDRALVSAGDAIVAGAPIAERLRDPRVVELAAGAADEAVKAGERWTTPADGLHSRCVPTI